MPPTLVVIPSVRVASDNGSVFMDRKAAEGLALYAKLWPGPVRCLMRAGERGQIAYGDAVSPDDLPFEFAVLPDDPGEAPDAFRGAALVLASGDNHLDFAVAEVARAPVVFIIEYTLATRLRIIRLDMQSRFKALKSAVWTLKTEAARRRAFRKAAGLQCNGVPAFDAYRSATPAPLLFFDTRTTEAQQIAPERLAAKQAAVREGKPLRLAFSGRLERMKGADHLLPIAELLVGQGVPFTLDIYGDGTLRSGMAERVATTGLAKHVTLHGPVPFDTALLPALIEGTDLFLCCHRQADPSCTYLETVSCGVPIVGYDNAAFAGLMRQAPGIGRMVAMDDIAAVAQAVSALDRDREAIAAMMAAAATLGRAHAFEPVFASRIDHLRKIAGV